MENEAPIPFLEIGKSLEKADAPFSNKYNIIFGTESALILAINAKLHYYVGKVHILNIVLFIFSLMIPHFLLLQGLLHWKNPTLPLLVMMPFLPFLQPAFYLQILL